MSGLLLSQVEIFEDKVKTMYIANIAKHTYLDGFLSRWSTCKDNKGFGEMQETMSLLFLYLLESTFCSVVPDCDDVGTRFYQLEISWRGGSENWLMDLTYTCIVVLRCTRPQHIHVTILQ